MAVDFPAPLGPMNPNTSPLETENQSPLSLCAYRRIWINYEIQLHS